MRLFLWLPLTILLPAGLALAATAVPSKEDLARRPVLFEPNIGQAEPAVRFVGHAPALTVFMESSKVTLAGDGLDLRIELMNAKKGAAGTGVKPLPGTSNYLRGNDPKLWVRDVPHFGGVEFKAVYPGIDAVYYSTKRDVEYDFRVAPRADPGAIRLRFSGLQKLTVDSSGDLSLGTGSARLRMKRPVAYQERDGQRVAVDVHYRLQDRNVAFSFSDYDRSLPLVIDPTIETASYYGGIGRDWIAGITSDATAVYFAATASSSTYGPSEIAPLGAFKGNQDIVVSKILSENNIDQVAYFTFIGGSGQDQPTGIALGLNGTLLLCGVTNSSDYPVVGTGGSTGGGGVDGVVSQLSADGRTLLFSSYVGGNGYDQAEGISPVTANSFVVVGQTNSTNFPVTSGALGQHLKGGSDAFVRLFQGTDQPGAFVVTYSSLLGGSGDDNAVAVVSTLSLSDGSGFPGYSIALTGTTTSTDFPTTANAVSTTEHGASDGFFTRLDLTGKILYSTYIGGSADDTPIAVKPLHLGAGVIIAGKTLSPNFPTTPGSYSPSAKGLTDGFVLRLDDLHGVLVWSTYLGGSGDDYVGALEVDNQDSAWVAGGTTSTNFPSTITTPAVNHTDLFVARFDPTGSKLLYSTWLGGDSDDRAFAMRLDAVGNLWIAGESYSKNVPTVNALFPGAWSDTSGASGIDEGIYLRIGHIEATCSYSLSTPGDLSAAAQTVKLTMTTSLATCPWQVNNGGAFTSVTDPTSGSGTATIDVIVSANSTKTLRQATVYVGPAAAVIRQTALDEVPTISDGGIAGGALSQPPVLKLAYNGIFSIFGQNFAPAGTGKTVGPADYVNGLLPAAFNGVCVTVNGSLIPLLAVFPEQINAVAPPIVVAGDTPVDVRVVLACNTANAIFSNAQTVPYAEAAPEFLYFKINLNGVSPVIAVDSLTNGYIGPSDLFPGETSPIKPGGYATIYAIGLGEVGPAITEGKPPSDVARVKAAVKVTLGTRQLADADVLYAGVSPGFVGLYQLNIHIPDDTPAGNLPLQIQAGTRQSPVGPYLAVGSN